MSYNGVFEQSEPGGGSPDSSSRSVRTSRIPANRRFDKLSDGWMDDANVKLACGRTMEESNGKVD
jgi:hypothetical protein